MTCIHHYSLVWCAAGVQSDQLNPAIVVEMFTNQVNLDEGFVDGACACITGAIQQHILSQRALTLRFFFTLCHRCMISKC